VGAKKLQEAMAKVKEPRGMTFWAGESQGI